MRTYRGIPWGIRRETYPWRYTQAGPGTHPSIHMGTYTQAAIGEGIRYQCHMIHMGIRISISIPHGMHTDAGIGGVACACTRPGGWMGWEGECGKEWEGVGKGPPIGTFRGLGDGNGHRGGGRWGGLDGQADSSFPLPVPYSFPISPFSPPHRPFSLPVLPSLFPIPGSPFPIRSLFSSRNPHVFPPGPAFVPPFTRFHTHFPTRVSLSVCASVPRHPCVCIMICPYTPGYALADLGGSMCTPGCAVGSASRYAIACTVACSRMPFRVHAFPDGFPHATACIRPCPPRCTHKCTYGRLPRCRPGHISRCAYGRKPGCALGRILRHPHGHIPTLRPGCTHISVPICRHASWCIGPYAR